MDSTVHCEAFEVVRVKLNKASMSHVSQMAESVDNQHISPTGQYASSYGPGSIVTQNSPFFTIIASNNSVKG